MRESNPRLQLGRLGSYHYTNAAIRKCKINLSELGYSKDTIEIKALSLPAPSDKLEHFVCITFPLYLLSLLHQHVITIASH